MIRWGILGAGNIAKRFAQSLGNEKRSELYAITLRSREKAKLFEEEFGVEKVYLDFDEFLNDEKIDAIYLSLPHGLHKEWAIKALKKGKAVLCEKPAVLNAKEMEEIMEVSREEKVLFMEAMKARFTPMHDEIRKIIDSGEIGEIRQIDTQICFALPEEYEGKTYHTQPGQGGCLLDSGTYCASWLTEYMDQDIFLDHIYATVKNDVDRYVDAYLSDGEIQGRMEVAFDRNKPRDAMIYGDKGSIYIHDLHRCSKIDITKDGIVSTKEIPYINDDFYGEISHFVDLLENGKTESDVMSLDDSLKCAKLLDTIRRGFSEYDENDLRILEEHERILQYDSFASKDALALGNKLVELCSQYDNELAIQIERLSDHLVIFQYVMDHKSERNFGFIRMKEKAAQLSGHSSMYQGILEKASGIKDERFSYQNGCLAVGGSFPIRVNNETVGYVSVSGLHEGKDYEIIVRALSEVLNKEIPVFRKAML